MSRGLPRFSRSSASVYYTERKPKNKNRGEVRERGYVLQKSKRSLRSYSTLLHARWKSNSLSKFIHATYTLCRCQNGLTIYMPLTRFADVKRDSASYAHTRFPEVKTAATKISNTHSGLQNRLSKSLQASCTLYGSQNELSKPATLLTEDKKVLPKLYKPLTRFAEVKPDSVVTSFKDHERC